MRTTRRAFLQGAGTAAVFGLAGCSTSTGVVQRRCPDDEQHRLVRDARFEPMTVMRTGPPSGSAVVLLHELPGMTPDDEGLARCLAREGFIVYVPRLFGDVGQDDVFLGYFQSCLTSKFACSARSSPSVAVETVREVCRKASAQSADGRVGVIGMCLTGAFPLALLDEPSVAAAVLCQPTLPFNWLLRRPVGSQKTDLGLGPVQLEAAKRSSVPVLAMRYVRDPRCPPERIRALQEALGNRVATIGVEGEGHSTLASSFDEAAFSDTADYLRVRLRRQAGPAVMRAARLNGRPCTLLPDGPWRAVE